LCDKIRVNARNILTGPSPNSKYKTDLPSGVTTQVTNHPASVMNHSRQLQNIDNDLSGIVYFNDRSETYTSRTYA
jgi:hypothetical protein